MQQKTTATEEVQLMRERLRLARDHMHRAQAEMERALIRLGPVVGQWFFTLEEDCSCGVTNTVGVLDIYRWVTSLNKRCSSLFQQAETRMHEPLVQMQKRGSRRGKMTPESYLEWGGRMRQIPVQTEPELPKISPAPKGVPEGT